jgi:hypothetical protein
MYGGNTCFRGFHGFNGSECRQDAEFGERFGLLLFPITAIFGAVFVRIYIYVPWYRV